MIYQFNLYKDLNSWRLDREEDRDLPQPHSIFFFPLAAKTNWTLRPFPFSSFFPATAAFRFKGTRQPSTPAHQYMELCIVLRAWVRSLTCLLHYVLKTWLIWLWPMNMSSPKLLILRHESIPILHRELSSPIFQSLWVSKASVTPVHPDIHFVQYKKA